MTDCYYCKRKCRKVKPDGRQVDYTPYWQCDYHGSVTVRHYTDDNGLNHHSLIAIHKDMKFQAIFFHHNDYPCKFRVDRINPYPQTIQTVITLDFHPDLTPENVQDKIKTYLLFS